MTSPEIENILSKFQEKYDEDFNIPTTEDWNNLREYFHTEFDSDFVKFINLMSVWSFPGEIYNASDNNSNGNDIIKKCL